jgi:Zn-dependent protease
MFSALKHDLQNLKTIPVRFDWTFYALLVFLPMSHYFIQGKVMGVTSLIFIPTLFVFVLLHEYGHCWAAQRCGLSVHSIRLWFLGGLARINGLESLSPKDEAFISIMGPMVNFIISLVAGVAMLIFGKSVFLIYVVVINQVLGIFNLIPAFPMDGGRILRSFFHWRSGNYAKATKMAANVGLAISFAFFFLGLAAGNFMLMFIFGYIGMTCYSILKNPNLIV